MKCPYCYHRTNDMPKHLKENKFGCHEKHVEKLQNDFKIILYHENQKQKNENNNE